MCERLETLANQFAVVVRDASGTDASPVAAARDAMAAAGRLVGVSTVVSTVAYTRMEETAASLDDGVRDSGTWAQLHAGLSGAEVGMCRRIGRVLARYPRLGEAFLSGSLRGFHLAAIDSIIPARFSGDARLQVEQQVEAIQQNLIDAAALCGTETRFRRFCGSIRQRLDVDGPEPDVADRSELRLSEQSNGRWLLAGDFTADHGAIIATLLEDELRRALDTNTPGQHTGVEPSDRLARRVRYANALVDLVLRGASSNKAGRVGLYLHLDLRDLVVRGGIVPGHDGAVTEAGFDITDDTLWALLADADVTPTINLEGTPLSYGRTRRIAPDILRRVLAVRDRTCCFPGCDSPPLWLQQHHLQDWADGGGTEPTNIRGVCRHHHRIHHNNGWGLHPPDPDQPAAPGDCHITRPDGTTLDPTPRWRGEQTERHHRHDPYRQHILNRLNTLRE